jgi:hypothetical protein
MPSVRNTKLNFAVLLTILMTCVPARAEPWIAILTGETCASCHANPTGGGMRTRWGNKYGRRKLPWKAWDAGSKETVKKDAIKGAVAAATLDKIAEWAGRATENLTVGGDLRTNFSALMIPHQDDEVGFNLTQTTIYARLELIPGQLEVYVDERVAPGGALNREAYALLKNENDTAYIKAGQFFLPFGFRLHNDQAFIRSATGVSFQSSDIGAEVGGEWGALNVQLAVTNGTAGASENDRGKQYSLRASYVRDSWRFGLSGNWNDTGGDERLMGGAFVGLKTGPLLWLGEADLIRQESRNAPDRDIVAGHIEAIWRIRRGAYLRAGFEYLDPDLDIDEDERNRFKLVFELFPRPMTQLRLGFRLNEGIPQNDQDNANEIFLEAHIYY